MDLYQLLKRLEMPKNRIHMVLDTDTYNEIDDQFALAYAAKDTEHLILDAVYAAPFFNQNSTSPENGMERSYEEILRVLKLVNREDIPAYRGSRSYLKDEKNFVESEAARNLVQRAKALPDGEVLYVGAIGAITNVASAILMDPSIIEKIVLVWLGGHAYHWPNTAEFNMKQDIAAVRVVLNSGVPFIQLPCMGCVSELRTTEMELRHYLKGKSELGDYLYKIVTEEAVKDRMQGCWSRVIWDVSVPIFLSSFVKGYRTHIAPRPIVTYDHTYSFDQARTPYLVVDAVNRDLIFERMFSVLNA